jgi:dihydropteroate synthase
VDSRTVFQDKGLQCARMRRRFTWRIGKRTLELGARTLVMGVLNVTPDSFSDGGRYFDPTAAVEHGLRMLEEGAAIVDVGGESTRPGAKTQAPTTEESPTLSLQNRERQGWGNQANVRTFVSEEEELRRVMPVISELKRRRPEAIVSIDTYKSTVARAAVEAGAEIVNDISGLRWDAQMAATLAQLGCGLVLMHTRGRPEQWRSLPPVDDMVALVSRELGESSDMALQAGVARERVVLDPGFGFGKNYEENHPLLARFEEFHRLGFPLMAGVSRKSFIGKLIARGEAAAGPDERLSGSVAAAVICILKGAHIIRAHDVKATVEAAAMADVALM